MTTTPQPNTVPTHPAASMHSVAFAIHAGRNAVVQGLGIAMVSLMGLTVAPWPWVLAWSFVAIGIIAAEHRILRRIADGRPFSRAARAWSPTLRIFGTTLYAVAAFALITMGKPGAGARMFAFALMSASMVHVLMRYYRSPRMMIASLAPYLAVLAWVSFGQARLALQQGYVLGAVACTFTIAMFAVQFWSARAQLAGAWTELMTAREAAEERERAAEAANLAKSQFLATMSHELRTPLHGVIGMAQALSADRLTKLQRERVKVIRRSSESLLSVLNDLLDLSRIEAGALKPEPVEFDLEHLARGVAAAYQPQAENKALAFEFEIAEAARGRYLGDAARIRRILYGLCENAVKFTQVGCITVRIDRDAEHVVFRVSDTGIGIASHDMAQLFDGFFQADSTLARRYDGAGIGLAICKQLTTLLGGVIEAESEVGKGSTFTLKLPLELAEPNAEPSEAAAADAPAELRVLAAEDNPTNQLVLKTLLAQAGIAPTLVENGREAVAAWEGQSWDIVLMDIQMPEMNGIEATRAIRLRERETGRARTPIVAVTANAMAHQVAEYAAVGMDGVVPKPFELAQLFHTMEQALENTEPVRQSSAA